MNYSPSNLSRLGVLQNPNNPVSRDIALPLAAARAKNLAALKAAQAVTQAGRLIAEEKRALHRARAHALNVDLSAAREVVAQIDASRRHRLKPYISGDVPALGIYDLPGIDFTPPAPVDHSFWWSETNFFSEHGLGTDFLQDGLHFFGSVSYDGDPNLQFHAGATATFFLQPERRPPSPNNRFNSEPHIELFGNIQGSTGVYDWLLAADDKWCKCRLFLRQTAFQFSLGQFRTLAEGTRIDVLIDEENRSRTVNHALPGFVPMPPIQIRDSAPNLDIIVDLEIHFDFELEGDSFIGISPQNNSAGSVLLRTFQWEPIPA